MIRSRPWLILLLVTAIVLLSVDILAISPYAKKGHGKFGIKGGMIGRADFETDNEVLLTTIGATFGLFADFPVSQKMYSGFSFDFHNIILQNVKDFMFDIAWVNKYVIPMERWNVDVKPAVAVGLGILPDLEFVKDTRHLTVKVWVELHFKQPRQRSWLFELGGFYTPEGGRKGVDVKIGPAIMLRAGYVF